jgi:AraC family transcriptional regulator of adaptative response/methylated-DNA-[protein]-cysteine methyltransferase
MAARASRGVASCAAVERRRHGVTDEERWAAVEARDGAADGRFVYGVTSTGVYCRPSCPSRRPRRENVRFFAAPAHAEAAGFRACLRCRPDAAGGSGTGRRVHEAAAYLREHADERVTLAELAALAGMSAAHFQRTFTTAFGCSPKRYQTLLRVEALKGRLKAGSPVSEAGYAAGFGSARALSEGARKGLGMSASQYRRGGSGLEIRFTTVDGPLGAVLVGRTGVGVCAVLLDDEVALLDDLTREFPGATLVRDDEALKEWAALAVGAVAGRPAPGLPLDLRGTDFQRQVWAALQRVLAGTTVSYGDLAAAIGRPTAVRAVASACGDNHVAVVVPCHRVVRSDGGIGGYKWGVERKRALLDAEGAPQPALIREEGAARGRGGKIARTTDTDM